MKIERYMERKREVWVDNVKVLACVLVLLGHLLQGLIAAGILQKYAILTWFDQTIYMFHMPLFFLCSGYIYQRYSVVNDFRSWGKNAGKKLIALGVPYFFFSTLTWLIKTVIPSVGSFAVDGLFCTLFVSPIPPYWFLYALFLCFFVTPTFTRQRGWMLEFAASLLIWVLGLVISEKWNVPVCFEYVLGYEKWFVLGMGITLLNKNSFRRRKEIATGLTCVFLFFSVWVQGTNNRAISYMVSLIACAGVVCFYYGIPTQHCVQRFLTKYTMPIFLMHSIFIAALRSVLLKCGVTSVWIHFPTELAIGFFGPVITAEAVKALKYPEFFLYPRKFLK